MGEVFHQLELLPILWLALLHLRGKACNEAWWWIAGAFTVSWVADTASHWTGHPFVSVVYPVGQAALIGFVFLSRADAMRLVVALGFVGELNLLWHGIDGPDIWLRTVAWGSVVGIIWPLVQLEKLRTSLLVTFGGGLLSWYGYAIWPGWTSYLVYKIVWFTGTILFCIAASNPLPYLRLSSADAPLRSRHRAR